MNVFAREKCSSPHKKPFLRPTGMSMNSLRMPAFSNASSQESAFSLVTIGKMLSNTAFGRAMGEVSTKGTGVIVGTRGASFASKGADIEGDANDFASM